jgi:hypothetical protein
MCDMPLENRTKPCQDTSNFGLEMVKIIALGCIGLIALTGIVGLILYKPVIRPWHAHWGAKDEEIQMVLPGDELVIGDVFQMNCGIMPNRKGDGSKPGCAKPLGDWAFMWEPAT